MKYSARKKHGGQVLDAAFSPDGSTLLTGGTDRRARLWRVVEMFSGDRAAAKWDVQLVTGLHLDPSGAVHALDVNEWTDRKQQSGIGFQPVSHFKQSTSLDRKGTLE